MKLYFAMATAMIVMGVAHAQTSAPSGIIMRRVQDVKAKPAYDEFIMLQGTLLRQISGTRYLFADETGQIPVVIEPSEFPVSLTIEARPRIAIYGEADRSEGQLEIDVNDVRMMPVAE